MGQVFSLKRQGKRTDLVGDIEKMFLNDEEDEYSKEMITILVSANQYMSQKTIENIYQTIKEEERKISNERRSNKRKLDGGRSYGVGEERSGRTQESKSTEQIHENVSIFHGRTAQGEEVISGIGGRVGNDLSQDGHGTRR